MKNLIILSVLSFALALTLGGVNAQTNTNINVETEAEVNTGVEAESNVESESSTEAESSEEESSTETSGSSILEVSGKAVRAGVGVDGDVSAGVNAWVPGQIGVATVASVRAFVEAESARDEDLRNVEISEDGSVEVSYARPARFLGIIPAKIVSNARVNAEGQANISFPWYRAFFAVTARDINEADLSGEMQSIASSSVNASGEVSLNAAASRIATLISTFRASAKLNAESNTEVEN